MGVFDSFYDEDSECPKCYAKISGDWQTKRLNSFLESWHKGDFLQYHKYEMIPEEERKRKYGDRAFAPLLRKTSEYRSDAPLLFNAKVPVHTSCSNCKAWLEAYARIVGGRFTAIDEIEADVKAKELVVSAQMPRASERSSRIDPPIFRSHATTTTQSGGTSRMCLTTPRREEESASYVKKYWNRRAQRQASYQCYN